MHLYEVGTDVRVGFKVNIREGKKPVIDLVAKDEETGGPTCIALGNSICRELRHPDDWAQPFRLKRANFRDTNAGLVLVSQSEEEGVLDNRALVLIDRCKLPGVRLTEVVSAREYTDPEQVTYSAGDGVRRDMFLFRPGNGLLIRWDKRLLSLETDLLFTVSWKKNADGLLELRKELIPTKKTHWQKRASMQDQQRQPSAQQ